METVKTRTLRPGYLVSLKTTIRGGVAYRTTELEPEHVEANGEAFAKWETEKTIENPEEHAQAIKVRSKCRSLITSICTASEFGLLCPRADKDRLDAAILEARALAAEFNGRATASEIVIRALPGEVKEDDAEALRAINGEVRDLIETMAEGIKRLDVQAVRDAANKARDLGAMLTSEANERVKDAIEAARSAARKIVKAGEQASAEMDATILARLEGARVAFLDLDEGGEVKAPEVEGRTLDLTPSPVAEAPVPVVPAFEMEG